MFLVLKPGVNINNTLKKYEVLEQLANEEKLKKPTESQTIQNCIQENFDFHC